MVATGWHAWFLETVSSQQDHYVYYRMKCHNDTLAIWCQLSLKLTHQFDIKIISVTVTL